MNFEQLLDSINPEIYENLKKAVELGKWGDGKALTREQRELSIQAVIAYETKHFPKEERSGYVPPKHQGPCGSKEDKEAARLAEPLTWK